MISLDDCVALCGLTEKEVAAIAEHEHVPEIVAATLARYLLHREHGADKIRKMIVDDIRAALAASDRQHASALLSALRHFMTVYPQV